MSEYQYNSRVKPMIKLLLLSSDRRQHTLTSTARSGGIDSTRFGNRQSSEVFSSGRVNSNQIIEVSLGRAHLKSNTKTLSHFSRIWSEIMESNNFLIFRFNTYQFAVARVFRSMSNSPLQRPEALMIHLKIKKFYTS